MEAQFINLINRLNLQDIALYTVGGIQQQEDTQVIYGEMTIASYCFAFWYNGSDLVMGSLSASRMTTFVEEDQKDSFALLRKIFDLTVPRTN